MAIWISTHAPRTGSDLTSMSRTPSLTNFNPRSPHGERRAKAQCEERERYFNPRSPHGERLNVYDEICKDFIFQPTLPARGATKALTDSADALGNFNPRSPHGERLHSTTGGVQMDNFNPRSPHGERRVSLFS